MRLCHVVVTVIRTIGVGIKHLIKRIEGLHFAGRLCVGQLCLDRRVLHHLIQ